ARLLSRRIAYLPQTLLPPTNRQGRLQRSTDTKQAHSSSSPAPFPPRIDAALPLRVSAAGIDESRYIEPQSTSIRDREDSTGYQRSGNAIGVCNANYSSTIE